MVESERTSNRDHPIAGLDSVRVSEFSDLQILARIDLDHGKVGIAVAADETSRIFGFVGKLDRDFCGILNHVMVGQNVPGLIDDESGSRGFHGFIIRLEEHRQRAGRKIDREGYWGPWGSREPAFRHFRLQADGHRRRHRPGA